MLTDVSLTDQIPVTTLQSLLKQKMIEFTAKKIFLSIFTISVFYLLMIFNVNEKENELSCDEFNCWLQKKEKLKTNIAKVCRKYRNSILLPGTALRKMTRFLHFDKGVLKKRKIFSWSGGVLHNI